MQRTGHREVMNSKSSTGGAVAGGPINLYGSMFYARRNPFIYMDAQFLILRKLAWSRKTRHCGAV